MLFWSDCWLDSGGSTFFLFSLDSVFNFSLIYGDRIILAWCQWSLGSVMTDSISPIFFIFEKENIRGSDEENDSSAVDQLKSSIVWWDEKSSKVNFKCENLSWQQNLSRRQNISTSSPSKPIHWWILKSYFFGHTASLSLAMNKKTCDHLVIWVLPECK